MLGEGMVYASNVAQRMSVAATMAKISESAHSRPFDFGRLGRGSGVGFEQGHEKS